MNELLWFLLLLLNFVAIMVAFRLYGKLGLYIWIPISVLIANIQVTKTINVFGLEATLGNIVYATQFLATDILSECYGKKDSKKAIGIGFLALICMTVFMQVALKFNPAESDFANESLTTIFSLLPRLTIASLIAYFLSNTHDIWAYEFWKQKFPGKQKIWIRNNASTFVSQLIDSVLFSFIAFLGVFPIQIVIEITISTYVLKWVVAMFDTPFIYLARKWYDEKKIPESF